jgi:hypothetical protein
MNKIRTISNSFSPDLDLYFENQVDLYIDKLSVTNKSSINILWLCEPDSISNLKKDLKKFANEYDYILTFDDEVLSEYKKSILHLQASTWVKDIDYSPKEFNISTIVGNKMQAPGHILRQKVWHKQDKIKTPKNFYVSSFGAPVECFGNPTLEGDSKDCMFYSQFHITIENCAINNYFSEKILDCFISKTVPIYWGCSNIGNFFNQKGIIIFSNINECIENCNNIQEDVYEKMLPYIEENYVKSKSFIDWKKNLTESINKLNIK